MVLSLLSNASPEFLDNIMLGLEQEGRYEAALVALPREGLFFDAVRGQGALRHQVCRPRVVGTRTLPRAAPTKASGRP